MDDLKYQKQMITLLMKNKQCIEAFKESMLTVDYFDTSLRIYIHAVMDSYDNGVMITKKSFVSFISELLKTKQEVSSYDVQFVSIFYSDVDPNDFAMLRQKIVDSYLVKNTSMVMQDLLKDQKLIGNIGAIDKAASKLADLVSATKQTSNVLYADITDFSKEYWDKFNNIRDGKIEQDEFISYGYEELDKTSMVGLSAGTLTLLVADVGSFKSTLMLNIGMNAWLQGDQNVLFVPLEMPKEKIQEKMLSRETQIPFEYINSPKSTTADHLKKMHKVLFEDWPSRKGKFFVLDSYEQRATVGMLRRNIERHIDIFKPRVVIVDYIANLEPDKSRNGRNDLEIGDMLKDLRHMGKPKVIHEKGFAVVSAAQLGREALKRVRRGQNDKISFHSEDLRNSHEYSADADNIFALFKDQQETDDRLNLFPVKCRYGRTSLPDGSKKAVLTVRPNISLILSGAAFYSGENCENILSKADSMNMDIDFNKSPKKKDEGEKLAKASKNKDDDFNLDNYFK